MATSPIIFPDVEFPPKFECLWTPSRYKIGKGGRGGAKSWNFARALLLMAVNHFERILCTREFQNSISESVHKLLCDQIDDLGLSGYYQITDKSLYCPLTGSEFLFAGLHRNVTKIKSMEGITKVWVEEAEKVTEQSWQILIPTIRTPGSEIWITFNPDEEDDPTSKRFIKNPPPDSITIESNWVDNPWFPEVLKQEMEYDYKVDPDTAEHVWGGKFRKNTAAQIFKNKYSVQEFEPVTEGFPESIWEGPFFGLDFGFSDDPIFGTKSWIFQKKLYIEYEAWGQHVENDDIAPLLVRELPGVQRGVIRADCSRPETISHVSKKGKLNCIPCDKWKGSVEDGIAYLKSFEKIIIHPRCEHMQDEARYYRYKVDSQDANIILREIVDAWNHGWDSVRYALDKKIHHKRTLYDAV